MVAKIGGLTLYSVEDLAEILGIQERTLRKFIREGKLKGKKLAKKWYVTEENLKAYFSSVEEDRGKDDA
jgi:excisionase family DNA binding protein